MDRVSSLNFWGNYNNSIKVLRENGYSTDLLKPPSLLDHIGRAARPSEPTKPVSPEGAGKKPDVPEGVKVELSRDSVQITIGPELAKSLKSDDLQKMFDGLYNTPQVQSVLKRISA